MVYCASSSDSLTGSFSVFVKESYEGCPVPVILQDGEDSLTPLGSHLKYM